jgi:16S rRNA (adenine1518-N6/adenine1519-N6)-dimethyltransferase
VAHLRASPPAAALSDTPRRLTRTRVRDLLERHGLEPSRALGQNFLCDPGTVDKIVRLSRVVQGTPVVEIGPGVGSLTVGLAEAGAKVLAVELDQYLIPALEEVVAGHGVRIVNDDALTLDWGRALDDAAADFGLDDASDWSVVANLPYNVSAPLILDLLATQPRLRHWLVMVQREVGERLAAPSGSKIYGIPSVLTAYWGTATVVAAVPAQVFLPQPKVESVLVRIDRHETPPVDEPYERVAALVRAGFGQRRKMVRRSLSSMLTEEEIASAGVAPTDRAEQLDLAAWGRLAAAVGRPGTTG